MSPKPSVAKARKASRRRMTVIWTLVSAAVVILLLYKEKTALLYVLATVSVTILLVIVALADLQGSQRTSADLIEGGDSAALGSGIEVQSASRPASATRPRRRK